MKRLLLLTGLLLMGWQSMYAQPTHTETSDTVCSAGNGVTNTFTITNPLFPSTSVELTFWAMGDLNATTEYVDIFSENGALIGRTNLNPIQCGSYDSTKFTVSVDSFAAWAADGIITFDGFFSLATGFCAPLECIYVNAVYAPITGPNDAGVTGTAALQAICPGSNPVSVTIQNFGTNQITSVNVDWEIDGIAQTGVSHTGTLDTLGGSGSSNASVILGNYVFNVGQTYVLKAWTSLPNGVADTTNINDTLTTNLALVSNPTGIVVNGILTTSADVNWNIAAGTNYDIIYGAVGFDPNTAGTIVSNVSASPYNLTGLNGSTSYDVYVRANCGAGAFSNWGGPAFFFTNCTITTAPYTEKFDDPSWVASGNNAGNVINPCWTATPDMSMGGEPWKWMPRSTGPTSGNGPLSDFTGGNFMYVEASSSTAGDVAELITPLIDVSGLTTPALYFMQHRFYTATAPVGPMDIEVSNDFGTTWTNVYSISGNTQANNSAPWELVFVNLGGYIGDTIQLKFIQTSVGCCGDAAIDSLVVDEAPLCPWPTQVAVPSVTSTTADLVWDDPTGTSWDIEWGPCGYTQGTGTFTTTGSNPYIATGLAPNTCYDVYIRANCTVAGNGNSIWIGPLEFRTACAPFTAPFTDNFDANAANVLPNCWSGIREVQTGTAAAIETNIFGIPNSAPNHVRFYNGSGTSANGDEVIMISPEFSDLTAGDKRIQFFAYTTTTLATTIIVGTMSKADTSGVFSPIDTVTLPTGTHGLFVVDVDVAAGYNGTDNYIGLKHGMDGTFRTIYIDDFSYETKPLCNPPLITSLSVSAGATSATVLWGSGSDGDETYIEWGTPGFFPGSGAGVGIDSVDGAIDQYTMTGLSPQTSYDVYIADSCAGGTISPWIGPISFITACLPQSMPYYESLDSWPVACWDSTQGTADWFKYTGTGGDNYAVADFWSNSTGVYNLTSPPISITQDAQLRFFWSHLYSPSYPDEELIIRVTALGTGIWDTILSLKGSVDFNDATAGNTNPGSFLMEEILLNPIKYTNNDIIIEFIGLSDFGPNCYLNDIYVENAPTCPKPGGLVTSNVTATSADLGWFGPTAATGYEIWYGPQGFYQGSATVGGTKVVSPGSGVTYNLTGLTSNTCYEYLVRSICTAGDTSDWEGPVIFCTPCTPFTAPYFENFDAMSTGFEPDCFTAILVGTGTQFSTIEVTTLGGPRSGPNQVLIDNYNNTTTMLVSPMFTDMPVGDKWVTFYAKDAIGTGESIIVGTVSSATGFMSFVPLDTFALGTAFTRITCNLNAANGYNGTDQYVAIQRQNLITFRDIYIDDFLYSKIPTGDLDVVDGGFIKGECLSTNDSIYVTISNSVTPADFSMTTLNMTYEVTGPANTNGTVPINSGQLLVGDSLTIELGGIDLSQVGVYNLKAWIDTSAINQIPAQDTIDGITIEVFPDFQVNPKTLVIPSVLDTAEICVESSFFGGGEFIITEQCQFGGSATGRPAGGWPAYLTADDFIEITGVPNADLGGITLEQWNTTALAGTYTFPTGTFLSPNGTAIIAVGQLGASAPSPSDFYYHGNGTYTGTWGSSSSSGRILKDASGIIIDAVISNTFTWPAASGVTAADWTGTVPATGGSVGNRLEGPDLNSSVGWIASATSPQDPNVVNNLVPAPKSAGAPGLQWTLNGTVIDTLPCIEIGPFASGGTYLYIVSYSNACGNFVDTVTVTVLGGACDAPTMLDTANVTCTSADLSWTTNTGAASSWIEYGPAGFTPLTGAGTIVWAASPYNVTGLTAGTAYDFYAADTCAMDTSNVAGPFGFTAATGTVTAGFTFNLGAPTAIDLTVNFDGSSSVGATSYDWDFGDGNIGTGQTPSNAYATNGTYIVTLNVTGGCGVNSFTDTVVIQGVGMDESILNQTLEIYPNPAKTEVTLSFTRVNQNARVALLDLSGKELMVREISNAGDFYSGSFDLSELSDGVYMLQISDGEVVVNRRLIKR